MIKKFLPVVVGVLVVLCMLLPSSQAALTKPNIPQFTVNIYDSSYDVEPTSTTDPFTGQPTGTPGQHVEQRTIEFRIKNPYLPSSSGVYPTDFHYDIRYRGHFGSEQDWWNAFETRYGYLQPVSSSEETIYKINATLSGDSVNLHPWSRGVPEGSTIDFQIEAFTGGYTGAPLVAWYFNGEKSGWSQTQTITLNFDEAAPTYVPSSEEMYGVITYASPQATPTESATSQPTQTPAPTEYVPSTPTQQTNDPVPSIIFNPLIVAVMVAAVLAVVVVVLVIVLVKRR